MMQKIDFLFIGPDKTGSSWIFDKLYLHPDCNVPIAKDLYFFDKYYDNGFVWYHSFFDFSNSYICRGELSHDYLQSKKALLRIKKYNPNIKLITCLRNPIERSFSQYRYMKRMGLTSNSFNGAINEHPEIINNSLYFEKIKNVYDIFNENQVKILYFDNLKDNPEGFAFQIFKFLGLKNIDMNFSNKVRAARDSRSILLSRVSKYLAISLRKSGYPNLLGIIKNNLLINRILFEKNDEEISLESKILLRKYFHYDIEKLGKLINKDLGYWLNE